MYPLTAAAVSSFLVRLLVYLRSDSPAHGLSEILGGIWSILFGSVDTVSRAAAIVFRSAPPSAIGTARYICVTTSESLFPNCWAPIGVRAVQHRSSADTSFRILRRTSSSDVH